MKLNTAVLLLVSVSYVYSMGANDISGCPPLPKRAPPTSVFDLRADDIKVIAALGDRYTLFVCTETNFYLKCDSCTCCCECWYRIC